MKKLFTLLILIACFSTTWAQKTISGKVSDAVTGELLPSVSIVVEGRSTGTVSDLDGKYILTIPAEGGTLTFSFVGYIAQKVEIGNQTTLDIALIADETILGEAIFMLSIRSIRGAM